MLSVWQSRWPHHPLHPTPFCPWYQSLQVLVRAELFTHAIQIARLQFRSEHLQKTRLLYLNRRHPRIVTTQLETLNEMPPSNISHVAIICRSAHVWEYFLMTITMVALELSMLHKSFPQLTAELRGCAYYWQCLVIVTISFMYLPYTTIVDVCELSKRNKHYTFE